MNNPIESMMYEVSQLFLIPVLLAIAVLFLYAFFALGGFALQAWQRRRNHPLGFELFARHRTAPGLSMAELEAFAVRRLEFARIATRVAPMLGLVATMIPMGPALKALADGELADVSRNLMVAFSSVILALIAAAVTYWIVNVRRRWYAQDLAVIEKDLAPAGNTAHLDPTLTSATQAVQ
ncbi:MAG: MotA/TolQ/ExbB proton channel family protein [Burkholderiaceae bacterium]